MKNKKAVLVGINKYQNIGGLQFTHSDINLWKDTLLAIDSEFEITTILDNQATKANILAALGNLVNDPCPNPFEIREKQMSERQQEEYPIEAPSCIRVFVFAGHGCHVLNAGPEEMDGLDEAICPFGTEVVSGVNGGVFGKRETVITDNEVVAILNNLGRSKDIYLIYDSCHSGDPGRLLAKRPHFGKYRGVSPQISSSRNIRSIRTAINVQGNTIPNACWLTAASAGETTPDSPSFSSIASLLARENNATPRSVIDKSQSTMNKYGTHPTLEDGARLADRPIFRGHRRLIF